MATPNQDMDYMDFPVPKLAIVKTIGGYYRVEIHGRDSLQDNMKFSLMDIGRGPTKKDALKQAQKWFGLMEDRT